MGNCGCFRQHVSRELTVEIEQSCSAKSIVEELPPDTGVDAPNSEFSSLQRTCRGFLARQRYLEQFLDTKHRRTQLNATIERGKPENQYRAVTASHLFKTNYIKDLEAVYGKLAYREPLYDGVNVEDKPAFVLESGVIYKGEWEEKGRPHGRGRAVYPDGTRYFGYFRHGYMDGWGRLVYPNGSMYEGEFDKDDVHGSGKLVVPLKSLYQGQFKRNLKHGLGCEEFEDSSVYSGQHFKGKPHGQGTLTKPKELHYEGEFVNGLFEGHGTCTWESGHSYAGQWIAGKMHGNGTYRWPDGNEYTGEFQHQIRQGDGTLKYADGREYVGSWKSGKQHGKGCLKPAGQDSAQCGLWKDGRRLRTLEPQQ